MNPGVDTIIAACPNCVSCDSALTFIVLLEMGVCEEGDHGIPAKTLLFDLYPNPYPANDDAGLAIRYALAAEGDVAIKVYDISGALVRTFEDRGVEPGLHTVHWSWRSDGDKMLPAGVYFLKFSVDEYEATKKLLLIKQ